MARRRCRSCCSRSRSPSSSGSAGCGAMRRGTNAVSKYGIRFVGLGYLGVVLLGPLLVMFWRTFGDLHGAWHAVIDPNTVSAFKLTFIVTAIAVPLNTVFGVVCGLA